MVAGSVRANDVTTFAGASGRTHPRRLTCWPSAVHWPVANPSPVLRTMNSGRPIRFGYVVRRLTTRTPTHDIAHTTSTWPTSLRAAAAACLADASSCLRARIAPGMMSAERPVPAHRAAGRAIPTQLSKAESFPGIGPGRRHPKRRRPPQFNSSIRRHSLVPAMQLMLLPRSEVRLCRRQRVCPTAERRQRSRGSFFLHDVAGTVGVILACLARIATSALRESNCSRRASQSERFQISR